MPLWGFLFPVEKVQEQMCFFVDIEVTLIIFLNKDSLYQSRHGVIITTSCGKVTITLMSRNDTVT